MLAGVELNCSAPAGVGSMTMSLGPNVPVECRSASSPSTFGSTPSVSKFPDRVKAFFRNHNYNLDSPSDNEE